MIICAWCEKITDRTNSRLKSHGICSPCADKMVQDYDKGNSLNSKQEKPIDCNFEPIESKYHSLANFTDILAWQVYLVYLIINL